MNIAVVGATGLVGRELLAVLAERRLPVTTLLPVASERSAGNTITFNGRAWPVLSVAQALVQRPDVAFFSAGGEVSRKWAKAFVEAGALVVDNSSAWRMDLDVPLVVPEINPDANARLIANPNCSTIQLVLALAPLHRRYGLKRVVVSTYQSVSGTGQRAVETMMAERACEPTIDSPYPHPIDLNCLPHCDVFLENDYTREEMKIVHETRKILNLPNLPITATAVRIPVLGGHSEAVNVELESPFADAAEVRALLAASPGLMVVDDPATAAYPQALSARGRDEVFVGRIRRDESVANGLNLWIVADNLRKGAATNAVQIVESITLIKQPS